MSIAIKKLKRQLFFCSKIKIDSYMYVPELVYSENSKDPTHILNGSTPLLYFSLTTKDGDWKNRSIMITERSYYRFMDAFNRIKEWFYDKEKADLFVVNDSNTLSFNYKYKDLHEIIFETNDQVKYMKIMPDIVDGKNGRISEGLKIYINDIVTIVSCTRSDFEEMLSCLDKFSFQAEFSVLLTGFLSASATNKIIESKTFNIDSRMKKNLSGGNNYVKKPNAFGL